MSFYERAWKERVKVEDKALLEHTINNLGQSQERQRPGSRTPSITSSMKQRAVQSNIHEYNKNRVAPKVGTTVNDSDSVSGGSVRSTRSSQLSHKGASTVCSSAISLKTDFSNRLTQVEEKLQQDRKERREIQNELAEIKALLLQQAQQKQQAK